jgi:hypothetical protein
LLKQQESAITVEVVVEASPYNHDKREHIGLDDER